MKTAPPARGTNPADGMIERQSINGTCSWQCQPDRPSRSHRLCRFRASRAFARDAALDTVPGDDSRRACCARSNGSLVAGRSRASRIVRRGRTVQLYEDRREADKARDFHRSASVAAAFAAGAIAVVDLREMGGRDMSQAPNGSAREAAISYLARGWVPVPLVGKNPSLREWQRLTRDGYNLDGASSGRAFRQYRRTDGRRDPADWLTSIWIVPRLAPLAWGHFRLTGMIWGRRSVPDSHYGYIVEQPPEKATTPFDDPLRKDGNRLVELRSTGVADRPSAKRLPAFRQATGSRAMHLVGGR